MAVPAHDQRDFEFAKKYGIALKEVIQPEKTKIVTINRSLKPEFYNDVKKFTEVIDNDGLSSIYTDMVDKVFDLAKNNFIGSPWYIHSEGNIKKILIYSGKESKIFNWGDEKQNEEAKRFGLKWGLKRSS